jgi:hypothetical protein
MTISFGVECDAHHGTIHPGRKLFGYRTLFRGRVVSGQIEVPETLVESRSSDSEVIGGGLLVATRIREGGADGRPFRPFQPGEFPRWRQTVRLWDISQGNVGTGAAVCRRDENCAEFGEVARPLLSGKDGEGGRGYP